MSEMSSDRAQRRAARRAERERAQPPRPQQRTTVEVERKRRGNFVADAWSELKKVEWPGQSQVVAGTVVVLVACMVVGTYLYLNDEIWKRVVDKIFLGQ